MRVLALPRRHSARRQPLEMPREKPAEVWKQGVTAGHPRTENMASDLVFCESMAGQDLAHFAFTRQRSGDQDPHRPHKSPGQGLCHWFETENASRLWRANGARNLRSVTPWRGRRRRTRLGPSPSHPRSRPQVGGGADWPHPPGRAGLHPRDRDIRPRPPRQDPTDAASRLAGSTGHGGTPEAHRFVAWLDSTRQCRTLPCMWNSHVRRCQVHRRRPTASPSSNEHWRPGTE
jgi:hypothetical protein